LSAQENTYEEQMTRLKEEVAHMEVEVTTGLQQLQASQAIVVQMTDLLQVGTLPACV
jgi:hypothetical protein